MPDTNKDKQIHLREQALLAAEALTKEPDNHGKVLRLYIEGKGCDGFVYGVCLDHANEKDIRFRQGATVDLVVDPETLVFVEGSSIDWVDDERGRGFLVENPKHKKYRGKFFKRERWQDWLLERREAIEQQRELK